MLKANDIKYLLGYMQKSKEHSGYRMLSDGSFSAQELEEGRLHYGAKAQLYNGAVCFARMPMHDGSM